MIKTISNYKNKITYLSFLKLNNSGFGYKLFNSNYFSYSIMESVKLNGKEDTLNFLKEQGVEYHVEDHEKLETVQAALDILKTDKYKPEEYTFLKNLFFKNKTGGFFFITASHV